MKKLDTLATVCAPLNIEANLSSFPSMTTVPAVRRMTSASLPMFVATVFVMQAFTAIACPAPVVFFHNQFVTAWANGATEQFNLPSYRWLKLFMNKYSQLYPRGNPLLLFQQSSLSVHKFLSGLLHCFVLGTS